MIIIDTSIWIEFLKQSNAEIEAIVSDALENNKVIALSVVFGELLQGARNLQEEKIILELWRNLPKLDEGNLFIDAGILSYRNKLLAKGVGLIDSFIVASARKNGFEILSLDKKLLAVFKNLNG